MQALADSWKQSLDEALQRGTATLKALRLHMQQQEAGFKACMQRQKQQCEAEFKALQKDCFANVEATAKLHVEADERAGQLRKRLDTSRSREKGLANDVACIKDKKNGLKKQNKGLTQEVQDQQVTIADLQSSLEACKGKTCALEGQNASLLQRSLELEHEQTALREQVQSLQRDLTSAHAQQAASSQTEPAQAAAAVALLQKQLRQKDVREEVLKRIVLLMGEQQNALTGEKSKLETDLAAALQANKAHAASIKAADAIIAQHAASLAAAKAEAKQTLDQHAKVLAAAEAAAQQAVKQAADAADMQVGNHLAAVHTITQAAKTEAVVEAALSHAADRASWAAEKADLLEKLQAASVVQQQPGMHMQALPREGACWTAPHEHTSHDQLSHSCRTVEQVMQQLQQLQKSCCQMLDTAAGVQCDADGQVAYDKESGRFASIGQLAKQVQQLQDAVPHALGIPHAAGARYAASQHSVDDQHLQDPVTVANPMEHLQQPQKQQQQQQAPLLSVQPQGMSVGSDAAQSCQQRRVELSEAGHLGDALPVGSAPAQDSPGQDCVLLQPGPLQNGHFRSELAQGTAAGLAAELQVQQGRIGVSTGTLALLH